MCCRVPISVWSSMTFHDHFPGTCSNWPSLTPAILFVDFHIPVLTFPDLQGIVTRFPDTWEPCTLLHFTLVGYGLCSSISWGRFYAIVFSISLINRSCCATSSKIKTNPRIYISNFFIFFIKISLHTVCKTINEMCTLYKPLLAFCCVYFYKHLYFYKITSFKKVNTTFVCENLAINRVNSQNTIPVV